MKKSMKADPFETTVHLHFVCIALQTLWVTSVLLGNLKGFVVSFWNVE